MLEFSEIRHLDGMRGNFEVADEREYVAIANLKKARPIPHLIFSSLPEIVEQQQFVFYNFWNKAIPAQQKIRELENGISSSITDILTDYSKAEEKEFDMIRESKKEIQIMYSTSSAFHLQEKRGILKLLKNKAEQDKNIDIRIIVPIDQSIKDSLSLRLLSNNTNNNILIQDIAPSIDVKIKSLVVDKKESLLMEVNGLDDDDNNKDNDGVSKPITGFFTYSNSLPTVLTNSAIFDVIYEQSVYAEELRHEGEIKDEFINTAAHELRTPTQAVLGYAELNKDLFSEISRLRDSRAEDKEQLTNIEKKLSEHHENILRNALRLNDLINNLLDVARFEEKNSKNGSNIGLYKEEVDLVKEIQDILDVHFGQIIKKKNIQVSFINNSIGENCLVYVDRSRLNQIITNLLDNAIKFSKSNDGINIMIKDKIESGSNLEDSEITSKNERNHLGGGGGVRSSSGTSSDIIDKQSIKDSDKKERDTDNDNIIYISISDTGKGISSKIMPRLFEKFATDSDFGTGLGLFITRKLIEAHGGKIWAFNNMDGNGSTFVFGLPKQR